MKEIIQELIKMREYYLDDISRIQEDYERERTYLVDAQNKVEAIQKRIDKANKMIEQVEEALEVLNKRSEI